MEYPFELPVSKFLQSDEIFRIRTATGNSLVETLSSDEADYIVQAINSYEKYKDALDWIKGATDIEEDRCKCGRPTGVQAIYSHAEQALKEAEKL